MLIYENVKYILLQNDRKGETFPLYYMTKSKSKTKSKSNSKTKTKSNQLSFAIDKNEQERKNYYNLQKQLFIK
ncbi:MAG: hypothetical protein EBV03_08845, partial [Proteobacteria bacterium]|nr:hypothetical protein [Pseudomonadota bacterium]